MRKKVRLVNNVFCLENIGGYFFRVFHGLLLFGRLLLFVFDKIPRALLIWGATIIWQVRVEPYITKVSFENMIHRVFI